MHLQNFISELRRRRVFRAAGIYIVAAWVAVQVASLIFPAVNVAESALRYVWMAALLLFPLAMVFAWFFELSADGLARTPVLVPGASFDSSLRRTDYVILSALSVVAIAIAWQLMLRIDSDPDFGLAGINPLSIAVLPLDNVSGDPEQQYFDSGIHAGLIASLSRVRALRVTSKTSTLRFRNADISLPDIGAQLRVARIIEGSIYRFENKVRVSIQLLDANADRHLWSATFEDEIRDIMFLQARITQAIAAQIRVTLSADEQSQFDSAAGVNAEAYEAFLKGEFHVERYTPQDIELAARYFQQAVGLDPDFALGHWGLSKLCAFRAQNGLITPAEARDQCLAGNRKAIELDPLLPQAYMALAGNMTWQHFDWEAAGLAFERAIELNPSYAEAHMFYSHYLGIVGRLDESSEHMRIALQLDPLNPFVQGIHAIQLIMVDEFQKAIDVAEEAMTVAPGFAFLYASIAQGNYWLGNYDESIAAIANTFRYMRGDAKSAELLETVYDGSNFEVAALALAEHLVEKAKSRYVPATNIGFLFEQGGDIETAVDWYELAYRNYDPDAPYNGVLSKNPGTNANPRYRQLLRDMKLDYWADRFSATQAQP